MTISFSFIQTIEELSVEHNDQMNRLRLTKEQEIHAVSSAFSHSKSLQQLMLEVQNSTKEVLFRYTLII